ncbi:FecR domain-containing protein [Paenibacillus ginsengarvi]|uniref:FecR protein domain-containing protein n=1 Tax=Paenibacillus ginsengarvi TaxID=400777 RepID=A0A3B0CIM4_9BACL|nr:FecR domain-containing protein [Paenibacillus ginsengarvi]RKN85042.1 hypothetical protein D7M11_11020 [Paenibacillus ginsengarvi]
MEPVKISKMLPITLCLTLLLGMLSGLFSGAAMAKESRAAIVSSVKGTVMVTKAGGSTEYRAFDDMSLNQGDHIRTEEGSSIVLKVVDMDEEVTIGPNTELYISSLVEDAQGGKKSKLSVWAGSLWFKVKKLVNADDEFEVSTPTAVMSVRGSNGYIEMRMGQLNALMLSGILETASPNAGTSGSGPAFIYPGQQILQSLGNADDYNENVAPLDISDFVANASPEIIRALLSTIQQIREENSQFVNDLQNGTKQIDLNNGLVLDNPDDLQNFGGNLTSLIAGIANEAIQSSKLPRNEVQELIKKANESLQNDPIDLEHAKPFDPSLGLKPELLKQKQQRMEDLKRQLEQRRNEQQQNLQKNKELLERLMAERERQQQGNAAEQQRISQSLPGNAGGGSGSPGTGGSGSGSTTAPGDNGEGSGDGTGGETPVDRMPPDLSVIHPGDGVHAVNSIAQEISVYAEQGSTVQIFKDGTTSPLDTKTGLGPNVKVSFAVSLSEGLNTFTVTAKDVAGNVTSKTVKYELITTVPELSVQPDSEAIVGSNQQTIKVRTAQGNQISLYKGETLLETKPGAGMTTDVEFTVAGLTEGLNTFTVKAKDAVGNIATKTVQFKLVTTEPELLIQPNGEAIVGSTQQTIKARAEQGNQISLYKGEGPNATLLETKPGAGMTTDVEFIVTGLTEGFNTFTVKAKDAGGNIATKTVKFKLVTTEPELLVQPNGEAVVGSNQQTIKARTAQGNQISLYKGEGPNATLLETKPGAGMTTDVEFTVTNLVEGPNRFTVTAMDTTGKITSKTVQFKVDTIRPDAPKVDENQPRVFTSGIPLVLRAKGEDGAKIELRNGQTLLGSATGKGTTEADYVEIPFSLNDGSYTLQLVAIDKAGNESDPRSVPGVEIQRNAPASQRNIGLKVVPNQQVSFVAGEPLQLRSNDWFDLGVVMSDFPYAADGFYAIELHLRLGEGIKWVGESNEVGMTEYYDKETDYVFSTVNSASTMGVRPDNDNPESEYTSEIIYVVTAYASAASDPGNISGITGEKVLVRIPLYAIDMYIEDPEIHDAITIQKVIIMNKNGTKLEGLHYQPASLEYWIEPRMGMGV